MEVATLKRLLTVMLLAMTLAACTGDTDGGPKADTSPRGGARFKIDETTVTAFLRSNFQDAEWYPHLKSVVVTGDVVNLLTDLTAAQPDLAKAACEDASKAIYIDSKRVHIINKVHIDDLNSSVLIERNSEGDTCHKA